MKSDFQIIAAPMVGITDQPFRQILRKLNPGLAIMTEMISCHSITAKGGGRNDDEYAGQNTGAQIFGADVKLMAEAAKILEGRGAEWIDINMGCPVPKVATRAGAGAFLMRDHKLAGRIMEAVVAAVKIPVSVKTRLGWDEQHRDSADLLRIANEAGVAFATVHARTRAQGYSGAARWAEIPDAALPVIFNGDIKSAADIGAVKKMGAAGAMVGRAMMGNPWIFSNEQCISAAKPRAIINPPPLPPSAREGGITPIPQEKVSLFEDTPHRRFASTPPQGGSLGRNLDNGGFGAVVAEHFDLMLGYYGAQAVVMFRKHAAWYAAGRAGANLFRQQINQISDAFQMKKVIEEFFAF